MLAGSKAFQQALFDYMVEEVPTQGMLMKAIEEGQACGIITKFPPEDRLTDVVRNTFNDVHKHVRANGNEQFVAWVNKYQKKIKEMP